MRASKPAPELRSDSFNCNVNQRPFCIGCRIPLPSERGGHDRYCDTCRRWLDVSRGIGFASAALRRLRK